MKYNFDKVIDRRKSDSLKWNAYPSDVIPMWIADMDFESPPQVIKALRKRVEHGVFGYGHVGSDVKELLADRLFSLYKWRVSPDDLVTMPGVVCALNVVCRSIGQAGDSVMFHTPVYFPFFSAVTGQGRKLNTVRLDSELTGRKMRYYVDFDRMRSSISSSTRLYMLCNPHNPVGRVFSRQELERVAEICLKKRMVICSDEIHSDLIMPGHKHIPIASISKEIALNTVTFMAPSKTFNLPGLGFSYAVIQNPVLRKRFVDTMAGIVPHVNTLSTVAAYEAYAKGGDWLKQLMNYLDGNRAYTISYIEKEMPGVNYTDPEATYLMWLDFAQTAVSKAPFKSVLRNAKVAMSEGSCYDSAMQTYLRLNFGCPRRTLAAALKQIKLATI